MFDNGNNETLAVIVALAVIVFFGVTAFVAFTTKSVDGKRDWTRVAIGVSAAILAVSAFFALF